jgi:carboxyl-terminal processing protease
MNYQNDKKSIILPIAVAVSLVLGIFLGATFFGKKTFVSNAGGTSSVFKEVLMHINKSYVDEVNIDSLSQYGIEKMLEKLDPHTAFLPPQDAELASADLHNGFDGIGVEFNIFNDSLFVVSPLVGGPSEAIGIKTGDIILKADTVNLTGKNLNSNVVFRSLRGPRNSIVKLTIKRKGTKNLLSFNVKRDKIPTYSIDAAYMMPDKKTGYIKVNRFAETTYDEFKAHLGSLKSKGMTQLMIDLRGNPGGYMDRATDMVDELVGGNDVIVYTKGKDRSNNYEVKASKSGIFEKGKIVVLVMKAVLRLPRL